MKIRSVQSLAIGITSLLLTHNAYGTHGYIASGFGTKSLGMGGVAAAYPQDSLVVATNPAGSVWLPSCADVGIKFFSPPRRHSYTGSDQIPFSDNQKSKTNLFFVPQMGLNKKINSCTSIGFALYGAGGMHTSYCRSNPVFGNRNESLGLNYLQLFVSPYISHKIYKNFSGGIALIGGAQRFKLKGVENFTLPQFTCFPEKTPLDAQSKYDVSTWAGGIGAKGGLLYKVIDQVSLGLGISTPVYMSRYKRYRAILAERGKLDVPASITAGITYTHCDWAHLCFDYQLILYGHVRSLSNDISQLTNYLKSNGDEGAKLGVKDGAGFGWRNISVFKIGFDVNPLDCLTLRAGFSASNRVAYSSGNMDANIIAPAIVKYHLSAGITYKFNKYSEIDIAYEHAFKNTQCGTSAFGLGTIKHSMYQNTVEVNYHATL